MEILVIDDNRDLLFNMELLLEKYGYDVLTASSGKEGLVMLEDLENPPDLIICDIKMPDISGFEFFNKISNNPRWFNIPFIFLTAITDSNKIRKAKKIGVSDILTKPFKEKE
jgi:CheY-like chemotaxis protein